MNCKLIPLMFCISVFAVGCQSLANKCPEEAAGQTSLLCAASGHYSGANAKRLDEKRQVVAGLKDENVALENSKNTANDKLSTVEGRRDALMRQLKAEQMKLADASKQFEMVRLEKNRSAAELDEFEARIDTADEQLKYLQMAPVDSYSDYEENLKLKQVLESELDSLLEELAE